MKKINLLLVISAFFILASCSRSESIQSIDEVNLYTLQYGKFQEQLSVSELNDVGNVRFGIAMQEGFFYIVNGESGKIMELNSYGDLLTLFYNEDSDTEHIVKNSQLIPNYVLHEVAYPFEYTGLVTVDSNNRIYAACTIPENRQEVSDDNSMLLCQAVLKFSRDGSEVEYIGQQGPGGTPFPSIKQIYTTEKDELVVVSTTTKGLCVYWFSVDGFLKYMIPINISDVPTYTETEIDSEVLITISNVVPDLEAYNLYVQLDYYSSYFDEDSKIQSGINYLQSYLYTLDIENGTYESPIQIPPYEESVISDYTKLTYRMPYDFLGITKSGWKFFIVKTENGFDIEMFQNENQRVFRRHFNVNHSDIVYSAMNLTKDGIIDAIYIGKDCARVVWYRTDTLIASILKG